MLNLLRFRAVADYSTTPELTPGRPITGSGCLIGLDHERWDAAMLVEQSSPAAFLAFASDGGYLSGIGHRTAALEDSRLLPLEERHWSSQA